MCINAVWNRLSVRILEICDVFSWCLELFAKYRKEIIFFQMSFYFSWSRSTSQRKTLKPRNLLETLLKISSSSVVNEKKLNRFLVSLNLAKKNYWLTSHSWKENVTNLTVQILINNFQRRMEKTFFCLENFAYPHNIFLNHTTEQGKHKPCNNR